MKRKLIIAALALLMTGSAARAQTVGGIVTLDLLAATMVASNDCPGVHTVKGSIRATADEAGLPMSPAVVMVRVVVMR